MHMDTMNTLIRRFRCLPQNLCMVFCMFFCMAAFPAPGYCATSASNIEKKEAALTAHYAELLAKNPNKFNARHARA